MFPFIDVWVEVLLVLPAGPWPGDGSAPVELDFGLEVPERLADGLKDSVFQRAGSIRLPALLTFQNNFISRARRSLTF